VQRLRRDAQQRGLQVQHAFLDAGQTGRAVRSRLDAQVVSKAGLAPAALYQEAPGQHSWRVLVLDVRSGRIAHERNLPAVQRGDGGGHS
jgi:hypothetical protein